MAPEGVTVSWPDVEDTALTAVIVPGTAAWVGRMIETLSPTAAGGSVGLSGTVTVRWPVVTW